MSNQEMMLKSVFDDKRLAKRLEQLVQDLSARPHSLLS